MLRTPFFVLAPMVFLAGCMPLTVPAPVQPTAAPVAPVQQVQDPFAVPNAGGAPAYGAQPSLPSADGIAGLQEREPDLCKASQYSSVIGQPASSIATLGIQKSYRIVEFRGIEPQDYDPNRVVFRLDASGLISGVDCG